MPGYPLSGSTRARWSDLARAVQLRMLLANLAVGVIAGLLAAHAGLHAGLPGHKVLFWLTPVLIARMLSRHPVGAMAGASAAAAAALAVGGSFAGAFVYLPLVVAAGGILDALLAFANRRRLPMWLVVPLLGLGAAAANLLCAVNRLLVPVRREHLLLGLSGPSATLVSYAIFGLVAGLVGAAISTGVLALLAHRRERSGG